MPGLAAGYQAPGVFYKTEGKILYRLHKNGAEFQEKSVKMQRKAILA